MEIILCTVSFVPLDSTLTPRESQVYASLRLKYLELAWESSCAPLRLRIGKRTLKSVIFFQAAACRATDCTSRRRPVSTPKIQPRTGTSFEIHGCDLTLSICSRVFCSGSL